MIMEKELNIAAILKDKPVGLKFYSPTFGCVTFNGVHKGKVYFFSKDTNAHSVKQNGKMYNGGECIIFPSKEMRDWEKFSWKKGDVLVSKDNVHIIFEKFEDDTYTRFKGKHYLWKEFNVEDYNKEETKMLTSVFEKANDDAAKTYISIIERKLGGKLNRQTLEIENTQPEFKDGDIAFADYGNRQDVFIVSGKTKLSDGYYSFVVLNLNTTKALNIGYKTSFFKENLYTIRLATEGEKQQLFDALEKEGKAWDAEKKQIVDLKPKCEFKPFDKVLGRNEKDDVWEAELFSHYKEESQYPFRCIGFSRKYCIPYNEETAHLLGTTDDWEGGEG
uniref:Uncharacterized protein n=1 Tax=Siphoviridae sp. ctKwY15 TaxID=2827843 RepID=A0A8S5STV9_9CAUD|nr:MAG TPA: hypothetical protein [Siphoviridae sp. ctKwY15]